MSKLVAFFEIPAVNFERAVGFYESVFGCKLQAMDCETEKMAFFPEESGICPGAISYAKGFNPSKDGVMISLQVADMEKAVAAVVEHGGKIQTPKTKIESENRGYFSVFIDCEGNRIGLYSDK